MLVFFLSGCAQNSRPVQEVAGADLFAPAGMRIHPIFTQVRDLDNSGKPDGIEAQLEFQDQFDDSTKAAGKVVFELFRYRQISPDPRGARVADPWVGSLASLQEQQARWNTTLRTYRFELKYPEINPELTYVLTAVFERSSGGRFFDRIILPGRGPAQAEPSKHAAVSTPLPVTPENARTELPAQPTTRHTQP